MSAADNAPEGASTKASPAHERNNAPDWEGLKMALNNAVWMHAPASLTLGEADAAVLLTFEAIAKHYNDRHRQQRADATDGCSTQR